MVNSRLPRLSLVFSLGSLPVAWVVYAAYIFLQQREVLVRNDVAVCRAEQANWTAQGACDPFPWSIFMALGAIAVIGAFSILGLRLALTARRELGAQHLLARAAHRAANLLLWIAVALAVLYTIVTFVAGISASSYGDKDVPYLITRSYLPILLSIALVTAIMLFGFVYRPSQLDATSDEADALRRVERERNRNLALGYSIPLLATAVAVIAGLAYSKMTSDPFNSWMWVLIFTLVAAGVLAGTRFASRAARSLEVQGKPEPKGNSLAVGANNLNLSLQLSFAFVACCISLGRTAAVISGLMEYTGSGSKMRPADFNWWVQELLPTLLFVVLAAVGSYFAIIMRNREPRQAAESNLE